MKNILQLLTDPENQPHQFIGCPDELEALIIEAYEQAKKPVIVTKKDIQHILATDMSKEAPEMYSYWFDVVEDGAKLVAEKYNSQSPATALVQKLVDALVGMVNAVKPVAIMNNQKYDALGVQVNKALTEAQAYLKQQEARGE
ncbi:hypothetical protein UFOVP191_42 [uncultured Caudovirales phage]|uniref:Phage protein n=1 Tax=uncultured Caudovirales phage TaxID=2100421 RepID=A0A6J7WJI6_9CAUD|nr:hypothetical protein UFOVP191_42 [uncultured Caudovirales phage]